MWETFFVCKPVCQWLDIQVSFSDGLLVGCSFLKDTCIVGLYLQSSPGILACRETTETVFGLLGIEQM